MSQWYPPLPDLGPGPGEPGETAVLPVAGEDGYPPVRHPGPSHPPSACRRPAVGSLASPQRSGLRRAAAVYGLVAALVLVVLIAGSGHAGLSSAALAIAGLFTLVAGVFQIRSRRWRLAGAAGPYGGSAADPEAPLGYRVPMMSRAAPVFSQHHCSVTPAAGGGRLKAGMAAADFLVMIADGKLSVIEAPGIPLFTVPATAVQITTPRWQRRMLGAGSILLIAGLSWSVRFVSVYRAEAGLRRGAAVRLMLTGGAPARSIRRGREINARFTRVLLEAGAADALLPLAAGPTAPGGARRDAQPPPPLHHDGSSPAAGGAWNGWG